MGRLPFHFFFKEKNPQRCTWSVTPTSIRPDKIAGLRQKPAMSLDIIFTQLNPISDWRTRPEDNVRLRLHLCIPVATVKFVKQQHVFDISVHVIGCISGFVREGAKGATCETKQLGLLFEATMRTVHSL